jgi:acid phosphatase family membrane protein YuiD
MPSSELGQCRSAPVKQHWIDNLDSWAPSGETGSMSDSADPRWAGLLSSPVFLSAVFSLLTAQFIKSIVLILKARTKSFRDVLGTFFWKTGGMPSSHSALAVSIAASIAMTDGVNSNIFILSLFFSLVVIRDALGVRRAAGLQAKALNLLGREIAPRLGIAFHPVREVHGHSAAEVVVGGLLGFFIALAFCTL